MISTGSNTSAPLIYCTTSSALRFAALSKRVMRISHFVFFRKHSRSGHTLMFFTAALVVNADGKLLSISIAISGVATNTSNQAMERTATRRLGLQPAALSVAQPIPL